MMNIIKHMVVESIDIKDWSMHQVEQIARLIDSIAGKKISALDVEHGLLLVCLNE